MSGIFCRLCLESEQVIPVLRLDSLSQFFPMNRHEAVCDLVWTRYNVFSLCKTVMGTKRAFSVTLYLLSEIRGFVLCILWDKSKNG